MKKFLAAVFFFSVLLFATRSYALVNVEGRYWLTDLDADVTVTESGVGGSEVDFVGDVGIDSEEAFPEGRITLEFGRHRIRYAFVPLGWEGGKTLSRDITFRGKTYPAGTSVDGELDADYHRLGYEYDFIDVMSNRLGFIIEAKYFDGKANLRASSLGFDETEELDVVIPTLGLAAEVGLPLLLSVGGEITGIALGSDKYFVDGEAAVMFKPSPFVRLAGGYRYMRLHLEEDDDTADLSIQGPFLMLMADF